MNIPCSTPIEGEHIPTIIRVILATNHASIQLKNSLEIPRFLTNSTFFWLTLDNDGMEHNHVKRASTSVVIQ